VPAHFHPTETDQCDRQQVRGHRPGPTRASTSYPAPCTSPSGTRTTTPPRARSSWSRPVPRTPSPTWPTNPPSCPATSPPTLYLQCAVLQGPL